MSIADATPELEGEDRNDRAFRELREEQASTTPPAE